VTDFGWLEEIPTDRPVLVIAEGLTPYLTEAEMKGLLNQLTARFPRGEMAFDVLSSLAGRAGERKHTIKSTGATFHWLPDELEEIEALDPGLELIAEAPIVGSPYLAMMPLGVRLRCRAMNLFPSLRNVMRVLRYRFAPPLSARDFPGS
jgi:O-methyltransferase involved in polyketide biosynthesis